jgi:hypothetical protein
MLRCFQQHFQGIPEVFYFQNPACFTSIIELIPDWNFPTILDFNTKEISTLIKDNDNIISLPTYASHPIPFDECVLPVFDHLYPVKKNTVAFLVNAQEAQGAFYQSPHPDFESICLSINDQRIEDPYFVSRLEALVVIEVKGFLKTHYVQLESQGVKVIFPTQFENQLSLTESPKHLYSDGHWITELKRAIDLSSEPIKKNSLTEHCRVLNTIIFNMKRNEN